MKVAVGLTIDYFHTVKTRAMKFMLTRCCVDHFCKLFTFCVLMMLHS
jgi:hypothetical protein